MAETIWAETDQLPDRKVEMTPARFAVYKKNGWRETTPPEPEEAEAESPPEAEATSAEATSEESAKEPTKSLADKPAKSGAKKSSTGDLSTKKKTSPSE